MSDQMTGSAGSLQLFAVRSRPTGQWSDAPDLLTSHVQFLQDLDRDGLTFLSGPLGIDGTSWGGHGLTIIRAASAAEAAARLAAEPYLVAGARVHEIMPWLITSGRITASLRLSDAGTSVG